MFNNVGKKIKGFAAVLTWIGIVASCLSGMVTMVIDDEFVGVGLLIMVIGSLLSWISSLTMYGFGELVDNSAKAVKLLQKNTISNLDSVGATEEGAKKSDQETNSVHQSTQKNIETNSVHKNTPKNIGNCQICKKKDTQVFLATLVDDMGTRYRMVCEDCFAKHNCTKSE